jgi:hypothetical protein
MTVCPICAKKPTKILNAHGVSRISCSCCGTFDLTEEAIEDIPSMTGNDDSKRTLLSHAIYKASKGEKPPRFDSGDIANLLATIKTPSIQAQLENLLEWLSEHQASPGEDAIPDNSFLAALGSPNISTAGFICDYGGEQGLITNNSSRGLDSYSFCSMRLTFDGWAYLDEITRGKSDGRLAFMAMNYGDVQLDRVYRECFQKAVAKTGFSLRRLDENLQAGLIDDKMRVDIRRAKFLIADLTYGNNGAYWEAGFAEGLGKPVIYTCEKSVFNDPSKKPHFDTNHHLTVVWEASNLDAASDLLENTIRATLPADVAL